MTRTYYEVSTKIDVDPKTSIIAAGFPVEVEESGCWLSENWRIASNDSSGEFSPGEVLVLWEIASPAHSIRVESEGAKLAEVCQLPRAKIVTVGRRLGYAIAKRLMLLMIMPINSSVTIYCSDGTKVTLRYDGKIKVTFC